MYVGQLNRVRRQYGVGWISEAWELFKLSPLAWLAAIVIGFVLNLVFELLIQYASTGSWFPYLSARLHPVTRATSHTVLSVLLLALEYIGGSYLTAGYLRMAVKAMRRQRVSVADLFSGANVTARLMGYILLASLVIGAGCILPVALIGYLIFAHASFALSLAAYCFAAVLIIITVIFSTFINIGAVCVAEGMTVFEAYRRVFTMMRPHYVAVLGAVTVMTLLFIAGICTLIPWLLMFCLWWIMQGLVGRDCLGLPGPEDLPMEWLPPGGDAPPGAWPPRPAAP